MQLLQGIPQPPPSLADVTLPGKLLLTTMQVNAKTLGQSLQALNLGVAVAYITTDKTSSQGPLQVKNVALVIAPHAVRGVQVRNVQVALRVEDGQEQVVICFKKLLQLLGLLWNIRVGSGPGRWHSQQSCKVAAVMMSK